MKKSMGVVLFIAGVLSLGPSTSLAADDEDIKDRLRRKTPSDRYANQADFFFRFHGYMSLSYTETGDELGPGPDGTPHILVSSPGPNAGTGTNDGGFRNDAALFVGGEPFDGVSGVIEIHFVGDATDPVITEAKMAWELVGMGDNSDFSLRLVGGRFWWPFGVHNDEWFSAVNRFSLISPAASEAVPAHYNEVGVMLEGEWAFNKGWGLNYLAAVGNGVPGFGLPGNVRGTGADTNSNRTLTGRLGLLGDLGGIDFELGFSAATGQLRDEATGAGAAATDFEASFLALGPDLNLAWGGAGLRSYLYISTEDFTGAPFADLDRLGITLEPSYTITRDTERYKKIILLGRYSHSDEDTIAGGAFKRVQTGLGANLHITDTFIAKAGFIVQQEKDDLPEADNNVFTVSLTNEF